MFWNVLVILEVINTPFRKRSSVDRLIAQASRISTASRLASTAVDASLEAEIVNFIDPTTDAVGELARVRLEAVRIGISTTLNRPAVVQDDIVVASCLEALLDDVVGASHHLVLGDVAVVRVPAVPAHGRQSSGTVIVGKCPYGWQSSQSKDT